MGYSMSAAAFLSIFLFLLSFSYSFSVPVEENFLQCFFQNSQTSPTASQVIYTRTNSSYTTILQSSIQNLRFLDSTNPKPLYIITPTKASHIQASIVCCRKHSLDLRVRSGGHDYEGLSYISSYHKPFIVVDLINLRSITIDLKENSMWVEAGATIGEVYYHVARASSTLAFPAGICTTLGVGGHFGGGGIGTIMRKFGLAADNIVDAYFIDANGRIHDRESMGEDLFWAIRGGGPLSFGVVLSWKIKLVQVPPIVTAFTINKTLEQEATKLVERWQSIAHKFHENLFIRVIVLPLAGTGPANKTLQFQFNSLFLGTVEELTPLMEESFPELGFQKRDGLEMPWIESVLYFTGLPRGQGQSLDALLDRGLQLKYIYKAKSDFVKNPISQTGLEGIWKRMLEEERLSVMILDPLGGRMNEISAAEIPFPFRKGYLYNIQYSVIWMAGDDGEKHIDWIRKLHAYLGQYVSKNPRGAFLNYRDLDLGVNGKNGASYSTARVWGEMYFNANFMRLASVKSAVDPTNFFRYEQSIPPLVVKG